MNTLGSWAIDRSYGAGRPLRSDRRVRMVVAPVLPPDTRRIRHIVLPQLWACTDRSLSRIRKGISRTKPKGGADPKPNYFNKP